METKYNDATLNRPEGERPTSGPLVAMNLPRYIHQLKNEPAWQKNDRNAITLLHNEKLRLVLVALHNGAAMNRTVHDSPMLIQVLEGRIWLETEEQSISIDAAEAAALEEGIAYHIHTEEETVLLLTLAGNKEYQGF